MGAEHPILAAVLPVKPMPPIHSPKTWALGTVQGFAALFCCVTESECGDGVLDDGETCDDGNTDDDDGCNNQCELVTGPIHAMKATTNTASISAEEVGFGVGGGAWTFEYWIRLHGEFRGNSAPYVGKVVNMNEEYVGWAIRPSVSSDRQLHGYHYNNTGGDHNTTIKSATLPDDRLKWHHFALTYDGAGTARLYIDGALSGTDGASPDIRANSNMRLWCAERISRPLSRPNFLGRHSVFKCRSLSKWHRLFPQNNWAVDENTLAQYLTQRALGETLIDEAGGDNNGIIRQGWIPETLDPNGHGLVCLEPDADSYNELELMSGNELQGWRSFDLNGDGHQDMLVVDQAGSRINTYFGDGLGNFANTQSLATGRNHGESAIADFNGDGYLDIVLAQPDSSITATHRSRNRSI